MAKNKRSVDELVRDYSQMVQWEKERNDERLERVRDLGYKVVEIKAPRPDPVSSVWSRTSEKKRDRPAVSQPVSTAITFARNNAITGWQGIDLDVQAADRIMPNSRNVSAAQKEYDDYVNSPEYKQKRQDAVNRILYAPASEVPRNAPAAMLQAQDDTEKALKAKLDYEKNRQLSEKSNQMLTDDMRKVYLMPEEDQKLLEEYIKQKDENENFWNRFGGGGTSMISALKMDRAMSALLKKYDIGDIDAMVAAYSRVFHEQQAAGKMEAAADAVSTVPGAIAQNVASVPGKLLNAPNAFMGRVGEAIMPKRYPTLAPVLASDLPSIYYDAVREETGKNIVGDGDSTFRKIMGYGYQGGMSTLDSLLRLVALGPQASLGAVAMDSFASGVREATQKGATPAQAYAMATVNAGLEVLTEKVSMDALLDKAKAGATKDLTKFLLNTIGQAGVEISEEEASLIGNLIAEAAILREKSEYNQIIQQLVHDGYSYADAKAAADKAIVDEAKETAIVSGISGGISGLAATVYNKAVGNADAAQQGAEADTTGNQVEQSNDTLNAQNPATQPSAAQETAQKQTNALNDAIDTLKQTGNVSNKTAAKILADPAAVQQLKEAGTDVSQLTTASEKRNAVKNAVRRLAGDGVPTTMTREGADSFIADLGQAIADNSQQTTNSNQRTVTQAGTPEVSPEVTRAIQTVLGTNPVDTQTTQAYNGNNELQGGNNNAGTADAAVTAQAGAELRRASGEGVRPVQSGTESHSQSAESGVYGQGHLRGSGELLLSDTAQKALADRGSPNVPMDSWTDAQSFKNALDEGRNSDIKNGWCVSPKELSDLTEPGVQMYLARNGEAGFVIKDGDIEAVFTNKAKGAPKGLADSLMLRALSAGGNKLDCYGEVLATLYSKYGFEPVARVAFNPEHANDGWNPSKGEPYIYVMKHNGDSVDTVAGKLGTYPDITKAQLDDLPTFGKNGYDKAMAYRDSLMNKPSPQTTGTSDTLGMQNAPSGDINQSKTFTNSGLNSADPDIRAAYEQTMGDNPKAADYGVKHNADTRATAQERTSTPEKVQAEYDYLLRKTDWTAEDNTTAHRIISELQKNGGDGAQSQITEMQMKIREINANAGQLIQSNRIGMTMEDASTPAAAAQRAVNAIMDMDEKNSTFRQKKGGQTYKQWQKATADNINRIGMEIEQVKDGDSAAMRDIIRQIARSRKTTAWFGTSQNLTRSAESVLGTLDFDDLKVVASTQLAAMPDDFRARTTAEVTMAVRKSHMLASLKTSIRNISGNASVGFLDAMSDSGAGQLVDAALSKITGKRTVGNDFTKAGAYAKGATNAAKFAALCVELDIPVETDSLGSFSSAMGGENGGKYMGKTFRPDGNVAMRAMYAFQKYMGYDLDVSDKIFEGGTNKAVSESLSNLQNSNLTDEEISRLSDYTANRRTFKDATWTDENGKRHGSVLSRGAVAVKNAVGDIGEPAEIAADVVLPFASVPANVAQTGIDYTVGIAKGTGEIISIIKDAKAGKDIDVARQRQAVSDFGRGVTGTVMIAAFAAAAARGIIKVNSPKDKDEQALLQAEGRNGAQFNWSAFYRSLSGENDGWQDGDIITSFDFLEPFNTQLYLGYELAQSNDTLEALARLPDASVQSILNSFMDTPMMTGLVDITDLVNDLTSAETAGERADAFAGYAGDTAASFIPQYVRQTAQLADGYYRDTRGDTSAEYALNNIIAAIPGLSKILPKKVSGLGEEQERGGFLETFVDPTYTKQYSRNEVTGYLEGLKEKTGDSSFFPDRQAPMDIKVDGETVELSGEARETYQKTYGNLVNGYYRSLIQSDTFGRLSDEQKADVLNTAKSYAAEHARASVSGYTTDKPRDAASVRDSILEKTITKSFTDAFDSMDETKLNNAYDIYAAMDKNRQKAFREANGGRVGYYLTARENGVSTETFTDLYSDYKKLTDDKSMSKTEMANAWAYKLQKAKDAGKISEKARAALEDSMVIRYQLTASADKFDAMTESGVASDIAYRVIKGLNDLKGTGSVDEDTGKRSVTNMDKWDYIAGVNGLSDEERDNVMKLYMPDYNPKSKNPNKTELKYDYLREQGYSAEQFVETYAVTQQTKKKREQIAAWQELGYSKAEAEMLYKLYAGGIKLTG